MRICELKMITLAITLVGITCGHASWSMAQGAADAGKVLMAVAPKAPRTVEPFPLDSVQVTGGPFRHAQDLDAKYLLSLEPDRLLAVQKGLAPRTRVFLLALPLLAKEP